MDACYNIWSQCPSPHCTSGSAAGRHWRRHTKRDNPTTRTRPTSHPTRQSTSAPGHRAPRHSCDHVAAVAFLDHTLPNRPTMPSTGHNNHLKPRMPVFHSSTDPCMCLKLFAFGRLCHTRPSMVTSWTLDPCHNHRCMVHSHPYCQPTRRRTRPSPCTCVVSIGTHRRTWSSRHPSDPTPPNRHSAVPGTSSLGLRTRWSMIGRASVAPERATRQNRSTRGMMTKSTRDHMYPMNHMSRFECRQLDRNCVSVTGIWNRRNTKYYMWTMMTRHHNCHCDCYMSLFALRSRPCTSGTVIDRLTRRHTWPSKLPTVTTPTTSPGSCCTRRFARR